MLLGGKLLCLIALGIVARGAGILSRSRTSAPGRPTIATIPRSHLLALCVSRAMTSARELVDELREARELARWYADGGEHWLADQWRIKADALSQRLHLGESPTNCRGSFSSEGSRHA